MITTKQFLKIGSDGSIKFHANSAGYGVPTVSLSGFTFTIDLPIAISKDHRFVIPIADENGQTFLQEQAGSDTQIKIVTENDVGEGEPIAFSVAIMS